MPVIAVNPVIPTESSTAAPTGGFSSWFKNIGDWLKSISPAGATQYDTDWLTTGLTITAGTDWTVNSYRMRRVGMIAYAKLTLTYTGAGITTNATGDVTGGDPAMCTLPAGWRPIDPMLINVSQNATREWFGQISTAGVVALTHGLPTQTLATNTVLIARGFYFTT